MEQKTVLHIQHLVRKILKLTMTLQKNVFDLGSTYLWNDRWVRNDRLRTGFRGNQRLYQGTERQSLWSHYISFEFLWGKIMCCWKFHLRLNLNTTTTRQLTRGINKPTLFSGDSPVLIWNELIWSCLSFKMSNEMHRWSNNKINNDFILTRSFGYFVRISNRNKYDVKYQGRHEWIDKWIMQLTMWEQFWYIRRWLISMTSKI